MLIRGKITTHEFSLIITNEDYPIHNSCPFVPIRGEKQVEQLIGSQLYKINFQKNAYYSATITPLISSSHKGTLASASQLQRLNT